MDHDTATPEHRAALVALLELTEPLAVALDRLARHPHDVDDAVVLEPGHVLAVLDRWRRGELPPAEVAEWADAVLLRDGIGPRTAALSQVLAELGSPELFGDLGDVEPRVRATLATG